MLAHMSFVPTLFMSLAGLLLVCVAVRDIFDVLLHPDGRAHLSRMVTRGVWLLTRRIAHVRPRMFALAGPLGLMAVIAAWAAMMVVGWALLLWPHLSSFQNAEGESAVESLWEAMHISTLALSTMGYGDLAPVDQWLRVVAPLEALIGFGLLTASVSWLLSVHPAVLRRRALAYELWLLRRAGEPEGDAPELDEQLLGELTSRVIAIDRDLVANPVTYYFAENDERFSLAAELPFLREHIRDAVAGDDVATRQRARMLDTAIDDLLKTIVATFHRCGPLEPEEAQELFARDHLQQPAK